MFIECNNTYIHVQVSLAEGTLLLLFAAYLEIYIHMALKRLVFKQTPNCYPIYHNRVREGRFLMWILGNTFGHYTRQSQGYAHFPSGQWKGFANDEIRMNNITLPIEEGNARNRQYESLDKRASER